MKDKGFTLIELLVVMAILGILISLVAAGFYTAQMRGRDAKRKSDLKEVANALNIFYSDHNRYPDSSGGQIVACSYVPDIPDNSTNCSWGSGEFRDSATTYFKILPTDPRSSQNYVYRVPDGDTQKFQLYAHLENTKDPNCLPNTLGEPDCETPDLREVVVDCGKVCNFSVTSTNATPTDP